MAHQAFVHGLVPPGRCVNLWHTRTNNSRPPLACAASAEKSAVSAGLDAALARVRGGSSATGSSAARQSKPSKAPTPPSSAAARPKTAPSRGGAPPQQGQQAAKPKPKPRPERPAKAKPLNKQPSKAQARVELGGGESMSLEEADALFAEVDAAIAAQDWSSLDQEDEALIEEIPSTSDSSAFKGFGLPRSQAQQAQTQANQAASRRPSTSAMPSSGASKHHSQVAAKTQEALEAAGWSSQVKITKEVKEADAIVSTKLSRGGQHNKLQQGMRTAKNAGVPFVCCGRNMTRDNLVLALAPVLHEHRSKHSASESGGVDALIVSTGVSQAAITQHRNTADARLKPGWKDEMLKDMGLLQ